MFAATAVVLLFALGAPSVWAGWDEGWAANKRGDYATALREWRPLAEQGDACSQYNLGIMYGNGEGVPQDYAEAAKWYRKAAMQGNALAQVSLGFMYSIGRGVPQAYAEALRWHRKAATQGNASAQFNLGVLYGKGKGVPQDYIQAHMWFNLAAAQAHNMATENRDNVAKWMASYQIAEAQRLASEWMAKFEGAACAPMSVQGLNEAEFREHVVGKILEAGTATFVVSADGTLSGSISDGAISGTWQYKDDQFCREAKAGSRQFPYDCQFVLLQGNEVVFWRNRGRGVKARWRTSAATTPLVPQTP